MMNPKLLALELLSGAAFFTYGFLCVFSDHMKAEFERYGLSRFRRLVGVLELLGGMGVLFGTLWPLLGVFSASGLALLMALGLAVRVRLSDTWLRMSPAAILLLANATIVWMIL